jgi:hypothetical protein
LVIALRLAKGRFSKLVETPVGGRGFEPARRDVKVLPNWQSCSGQYGTIAALDADSSPQLVPITMAVVRPTTMARFLSRG